jgi:hypothetical protein
MVRQAERFAYAKEWPSQRMPYRKVRKVENFSCLADRGLLGLSMQEAKSTLDHQEEERPTEKTKPEDA